MRLQKHEKKAVKKAAAWLRSIKEETLIQHPHRAYHAKLQSARQKPVLTDQQWIDRTGELQENALKTRVHRHKSP